MTNDYIKNNEGQVIVEALIALAILSVGIVGILVLISSSLRSITYTPNRYLAVNLAAEGIELVKNIIDSNILAKSADKTVGWDKGIDVGSYEIDYDDTILQPLTGSPTQFGVDSNGFYAYLAGGAGNPFSFSRKIEISKEDIDANGTIDKISAISTVYWQEKGQNFEVSVQDRFYNWAFFLDQ